MTRARARLPGVVSSAAQAAVLGLVGVAAGFVSVASLRSALLIAAAPLFLWILLNPTWGIAAGVATLPILIPLVGSEGSSAIVSTSDAFFLAAAAGLVPLLLLRDEWRERAADVRTLFVFCVPFLGWLAVVLAAHFSIHSLFKTLTAVEMTVLPMLLGVVVLHRKQLLVGVYGFLSLAGVLAVIWALQVPTAFSGGKNYAGQLFANAILLVLVLRGRSGLRVALLLLYVAGLFFAASRGAMVGIAFGALTLLAVRGLGSWKRTVLAVGGLALVVVVGYNTVPLNVQQKVLSIVQSKPSASAATGADEQAAALDYNVKLRETYRNDALDLIRSHPLLGVGLGNYDTGAGITRTVDPHNVVLRTAGEGGLPNVICFAVMIGGTGLVVARRLGRNPWAGPALAMQVAIITHGLVDVYWVRGIPILAWFMIGLALNPRLDLAPKDRAPRSRTEQHELASAV